MIPDRKRLGTYADYEPEDVPSSGPVVIILSSTELSFSINLLLFTIIISLVSRRGGCLAGLSVVHALTRSVPALLLSGRESSGPSSRSEKLSGSAMLCGISPGEALDIELPALRQASGNDRMKHSTWKSNCYGCKADSFLELAQNILIYVLQQSYEMWMKKKSDLR